MKTIKLIILLSMFFAISTSASLINRKDDFSEAIMKAKKHLKEAGNKNDEKELIKVRGEFERLLQLKKNQWLVNYYLAAADFYISYAVMEKDKEAMKKYTISSLELLDKVTDEKEDFAEAWIMKMAVNSNRWMYEPEKMNQIIARITEGEEMSKKFDPENPRIYLVKGLNTYYTPENFGGGPLKAKPILETAWEKFETYKIKDETYPDWGIEIASGMLALISLSEDKMDDAKKWIDKGLEKEPESSFIKEDVMKQYDEKVKK